jgi:hypothetical protein
MKVNKLLVLMIIGFSIFFSPVTFSKQKKSKSTVVLDDLRYVGTDEDVVKPGQEIKPDGINDWHFQMVHDFQKNDELVSVVITRKLSTGGFGGNWQTNNANNWVLAVKADGKALNATANLLSLGNLSGKVKLDFYIAKNNDPKLTEKNNSYDVSLTTKDKQGKEVVIIKTVTIK